MRIILFIAIVSPFFGLAQIGGQASYQSLSLTTNARAAALAGTSVSVAGGDLSQFFENPATLDSVSSGDLFLNINPYFTDAIVYSGAYAFDVKNIGTFAAGLNYVNFGSFEMTEETGEVLGEFQVQDYNIVLGKAHQLGPFVLGASLKLIHSSIDTYGSTAIVGDIGGLFRVNRNWSIGMVFQNVGGKISNYTSFETPDIPFDVKIGTSFKPEYMPLRFTLTSTNLVDENFTEESSSQGRSNSQIDKVLKRVNVGAELLLSQNFQLLFGYSHKRKQELKLNDLGGGAGFSFGLMMKIKRIELRYSRATFHAAAGTSFISLQTNLKDFKRIL
ncbi:MAG: type IX secretion system protein PorQ [Ekhidna sp.]